MWRRTAQDRLTWRRYTEGYYGCAIMMMMMMMMMMMTAVTVPQLLIQLTWCVCMPACPLCVCLSYALYACLPTCLYVNI